LDELLEKGDMTTNASERQKIYSEVQKIIVDNGLALPMRIDYYIYGIANNVEGWKTEPGGWPLAYNMWLSGE
jgi:peptide/nickel transport system substrate-binding protein